MPRFSVSRLCVSGAPWYCAVSLQKIAEEEGPETEDAEDAATETTGNTISRLVEKVLNVPGISFLKPSLSGLIPVLASSLLTALAVVGIPAALLAALLFSSLFGGKKASSVVSPILYCIAGMVVKQ